MRKVGLGGLSVGPRGSGAGRPGGRHRGQVLVAQGLESRVRVSGLSWVLGGRRRIHTEKGHGQHHYTKLPQMPLGGTGGVQNGSLKAVEEAPQPG